MIGWPGRVADLERRLRLPEPVADLHAPRLLDLLDDLGVERLAGADDLGRREGERRQVGLDEHPPHRRRGAEAGDAAAIEDGEHRLGVETRVVHHQHAGLGDPGREDVAPRVLGPPGRRDVQVDVARFQPDPVHRRQVPDGVRGVGVLDQLRLGRRSRCEVQQQRVGPVRDSLGVERRRRALCVGVCVPARRARRRRRSGVYSPATSSNLPTSAAPTTTWRAPPRSSRSRRSAAVSSVVAGITTAPSFIAASSVSHSSTWLPSMRMIRSPRATPRPRSQLATWFDRADSSANVQKASDPSSSTIHRARACAPLDVGGDGVEVVEGPVERADLGPAEVPHGGLVVLAMGQEERPRLVERPRRPVGAVGPTSLLLDHADPSLCNDPTPGDGTPASSDADFVDARGAHHRGRLTHDDDRWGDHLVPQHARRHQGLIRLSERSSA